jgi:hypothetical protein
MTEVMAKNRIGRVQRAVRRALIAAERPVCTGEIMRWAFPRLDRYEPWRYWSVHRAASKFAIRLGKQGGSIIWGPAPDATYLRHDD